MTMGIQEILAYIGPAESGSGQGGVGSSKEKREVAREDEHDRSAVSGEARAMYEADQSRRIIAVRERVHQGFYLRKEILDEVVSGLVKEMADYPPAHTQN
jgi:hypothetical protein